MALDGRVLRYRPADTSQKERDLEKPIIVRRKRKEDVEEPLVGDLKLAPDPIALVKKRRADHDGAPSGLTSKSTVASPESLVEL